MGEAQERLRDAAAALGQTVQREDIPPLQLPDLTAQDARTHRPPLRAWPRLRARAWLVPAAAAAAVVAVIGLVVLVTQAEPGGAPPAAGSAIYQKALSYARCMRANGEPTWPDPDRQGSYDRPQAFWYSFHGPQYRTAMKACQELVPLRPAAAAQARRDYHDSLTYAVCMRSNGYPSFPDPTPIPDVKFTAQQIRAQGIDATAPRFQSTSATCNDRAGLGPRRGSP